MKKKVLITGIGGFVGSVLARKLLQDGHEIYAFLKHTTNTWRIDDIIHEIELYDVDLCNKADIMVAVNFIEPDIIYHLAAHGAYSSQTDADKIIQTNIMGTWNLLQACAQNDFELFVNTGSSSEYGFKQFAMRETDCLEPNSFYSAAKCAQTLLCQQFARSHELPIVTFRLFSAYGPYEEPSRFIPSIISKCLNNENLILSSPETSRDFVFIDDVVDAYINCSVTKELYGEIFNIGTGIQYNLEQIVNKVINLTGSRSGYTWNSMEQRIWDTDTWVCDCSKSRNILQWTAKNDIISGLTQTIRWVHGCKTA